MKNTNHEEYHEGKENSKPIINFTPDILSFRQALVFLDITASTLYKKTHLRTIRFFKPSNKRIYFLKEDLINYMLSNKQEPIEKLERDIDNRLNKLSHE